MELTKPTPFFSTVQSSMWTLLPSKCYLPVHVHGRLAMCFSQCLLSGVLLVLVVIIFLPFHGQIFLRELISNASDALDKIRFIALTDKGALAATEELSIKIKADRDNNVLHITDTGIGQSLHCVCVCSR